MTIIERQSLMIFKVGWKFIKKKKKIFGLRTYISLFPKCKFDPTYHLLYNTPWKLTKMMKEGESEI